MDERKRSGCAPIGCLTLAGLMLVLVLYVLSIGPVYRSVLIDQRMSRQTFDTIYAPLLWVINTDTQPGYWLDDYTYWWLPPDAPATTPSTPAPD